MNKNMFFLCVGIFIPTVVTASVSTSVDQHKSFMGHNRSESRRIIDNGDYGLCFDVVPSPTNLVPRLLLAVLHARENNQ